MSSPSYPKPEPVGAVPVQDEAATKKATDEAAAAARRAQKRRRGRSATILTNPADQALAGSTSLLGGGTSA
jgi:hypothetical protein